MTAATTRMQEVRSDESGAQPVERAGRVLGFDVVRAIAGIAVIWIHAGRSEYWGDHNFAAVGSWGTAFLNSLAGFFVVWSLKFHNRGGMLRFAGHRVFRLYGAMVIWSLIYVGARGVNFALFGKRTMLDWNWYLLYLGTTYHLWFLTYLLIITLLTLPLVWVAMRDRRTMVSVAVGMLLVATALLIMPAPLWSFSSWIVSRVVYDLYYRAPGFLLGLAIGLWLLAGFRPQVRMMHALACAGIAAVAMYLAVTTELPRHILNRLAATAAFIVALAPWRGRIAEFVGAMGKLGFGVYLCHVLFVEGFISARVWMGWPSTIETDLIVFGLSVVASFAMAWMIRRVKWLAWLIP